VLVLVAAAAVALLAMLAFGSPFSKDPVSTAQIEHAVAQRTRGQVQVVLCNQEVLPGADPSPDPRTWTCDTYLGPSRTDTRNGPSYEVIVSADRDSIQSIRRVPTH
jgi:hypothetical protein